MTCLIYLFKWFSLCKRQLDCKHAKCFERRRGSLLQQGKSRSSFTCFHLRASSPPPLPALPTGSRQTSSFEARSSSLVLSFLHLRLVYGRCVVWLRSFTGQHVSCGACPFVEGFCTTFTIHNCMHALARRELVVIGQEDLHRHWWVQQQYTRHSFLRGKLVF